jgi:hypothetical protein
MAAAECPPLLSPESTNCSGRGVCISSTWCECAEGWTGVGDFAFGSPTCNVNISAVKALWGILGVVHFIQIFCALYFLKLKLEKQRKSSDRMISTVMVLLNLIGNVFFCSTALIRVVYTTTRTIGSDALTTVLFTFGCAFFWTMIHIFVYSFMLLAYSQAMRGLQHSNWSPSLKRFRMVLLVSATCSVVFCLAPLGMLANKNTQGFADFATVHYVGLGVNCFITGSLVLPVFIRRLMHEIKRGQDAIIDNLNGSKAEYFERLYQRIARFLSQSLGQIWSQSFFALLFGCWPFLQVSGSSYFLPVAWISGCSGGFLIMYVSAPVKRNAELNGTSSDPDKLRMHTSNPLHINSNPQRAPD